ncbi:protein translocase subunit SecF, partial [Mycobacterium sp. ITM-2017-0098]
VWLLGVGTLMDLALVQLVGVIVGTYSSIYFATPLLVTLRERTDVVRKHTRRVLNRRQTAAARAVGSVGPAGAGDGDVDGDAVPAATAAPAVSQAPPPDKPAPGARPVRPTSSRTGRPSGKRSPRNR